MGEGMGMESGKKLNKFVFLLLLWMFSNQAFAAGALNQAFAAGLLCRTSAAGVSEHALAVGFSGQVSAAGVSGNPCKTGRDFGEGGEKIRFNDYDCKRREKSRRIQADGSDGIRRKMR